MRILLGAAACTALVASALGVTAPTAAACPSGTVQSDFSGVCVSGGEPDSQPVNGELQSPIMSSEGAFTGGPDSLPSVDGIPCTPQQLGTCIGLAESQR